MTWRDRQADSTPGSDSTSSGVTASEKIRTRASSRWVAAASRS